MQELAATIDAMNFLKPQTPETIMDKSLIVAAIITDRSKGYSMVDQEAEAGFRSVSVPIYRYDGGSIYLRPPTSERMSTASTHGAR